MWISLALLILYGLWAYRVWCNAPPVISEAELESEEFRYSYATTPLRHWGMIIGSCSLYAFLLWFITFAIAELILREFFADHIADKFFVELFVFGVVAGTILFVSRLPKLTQQINEVCCFFQRCQFFPMLPSIVEEDLIEQIAKLPLGTIPKEISDTLAKDKIEFADGDQRRVSAEFQKLEIIYKELEQLAKKHNGIVRRFYFGNDWELVQSQFTIIDKAMNSNNDEIDEALAKNIHTCLYYSYSLLTRVIMETTTSAAESKALFKHYGFDVKL